MSAVRYAVAIVLASIPLTYLFASAPIPMGTGECRGVIGGVLCYVPGTSLCPARTLCKNNVCDLVNGSYVCPSGKKGNVMVGDPPPPEPVSFEHAAQSSTQNGATGEAISGEVTCFIDVNCVGPCDLFHDDEDPPNYWRGCKASAPIPGSETKRTKTQPNLIPCTQPGGGGE